MQSFTLSGIIQERRNVRATGITFIEKSDREIFLSYGELFEKALKALSFLQKAGMRPCNELVFQIDDNQTMIIVFWACILGGFIPVPLSVGHTEDHKQKLFNIWPVLNNSFLIISVDKWSKLEAFARQKGLTERWSDIERKRLDENEVLSARDEGRIHPVHENDIAFVQFSSGSTGDPKGVMLTHANLIANVQAISWAAGYTDSDSMMSWMPLTHDMGLIGFHFNPLFCNMNQYLMPTSLFIRRPALWLDKASEHGVSILCSPNFGFKYVLKHAKPGEDTRDLSPVRLLYNGAEPISEEICREFGAALRKHGLRETAMRPVYGLAEATLAVSISQPGDQVMALHLDRNGLNVGERIREKPPGVDSAAFVNVGEAIAFCSFRIADHQDGPLADQTIGHVQIKGRNVTAGYYNNPGETAKAFAPDGWLRTGDLGFVKDNALFITGRAKDVIFLNGQNYYPHDIERIAESAQGVALNTIAVTGFFDHLAQQEKTVAFVLHRGDLGAFVPVVQSVRAAVNGRAGFELNRVIPVKDIPRTTSGKLQRFKLLEAYRNGSFSEVERQLNQLLAGSPAGEPASDTERKLLGIWQAILGNECLGVDQKFFECGGNSLRASELAMALVRECGVELPLTVLLEKQTIRELANEIGRLERQEYQPIPVVARGGNHPVSSAQSRLYYAWQVAPTATGYNTPVAFRVEGEVNPDRLEACIRQLIARHDAFRMSFAAHQEPVFTVHDQADFVLARVWCSRDELEGRLRSLVQPFDLHRAPLLRAAWVAVDAHERVLFLDFHHIITDGLSVVHFTRELCWLYAGKELPAAPVGYKAYAYWEKQRMQSADLKGQEAFWLQQLSGGVPALEMPLDLTRPATFNYAGARIGFGLDVPTSRRLRELAAARGVTLHVLLFTVYTLLLSKYTGQRQIVVGIPVAGRRHPDLQAVQGMFVNNLAVKTVIEGDEPFGQLLERQRKHMEQVLRNQEYPFEALIGKVGEKRNVSRNPVFDTMFVYQNMELPREAGLPFTLSPCFFDPGYAKFDVSLEVFERGESISGGFEYATSLFQRETVLRLMGHYKNLLGQVVQHPDRAVADLSLLNEEEYDQIRKFNDTQRSFPGEKTIHQLFEAQAAKTPAATALEYNGETMTYHELDRAANGLARLLKEKGIGPDQVVAVVMERTPALLISLLGILKAGGCYLPVDTVLPGERVQYMIADSRCRVVISDARHAGRLAAMRVPDLCVIDAEWQDAFPPTSVAVPSANAPGDLAYVVYTSGTTGQPKGVMIEHRALVNYITWAATHYVQNEAAAFPLFTSISFDLTVTSIFTPLVTGNCIVLYPEGREPLLEQIIRDNKTEVIKLTPSHLRMLRDVTIPAQSRIKRFIVGGEQLETQLAREIYDKFGGNVALYNEYGPTEATVGCMIHAFEPQEQGASVPIGVPAANTRIYLLDPFGKPVPVGVTGELYLAGAGIARGYLFRGELTEQRFLPDPFVPGGRMYRTGDLARRLPSGILEYIGRSDQQVKINGYRIEPAEIEQQLTGYPGIQEALVTLAAVHKAGQQLCAYYRTDGKVEEAALKSFLAARLPHYMIPVHFIAVEKIPLTRSGKVDYAALPAPQQRETSRHARPASATEAKLLRVWEEVLGEQNLQVTDNFYELGGDSIKAVQIAARLFEQGIAVDVKTILTYHTVAQIAPFTESGGMAAPREQGIAQGERNPLPMEKWFLGRNFRNPNFYNQSVLLKLNRETNKDLLGAAFDKLFEHHDGLRINYDPARQVFFYNNRHLATPFAIQDYAFSPNDPQPFSLRQAPFPELKSSFDIAGSLLIRAARIAQADGTQYLFITAHHLVVDGVSWRILLEDLYRTYAALEKGEVPQLPPKTTSLAGWERVLREYVASGAVMQEEPYWRGQTDTAFAIPQDFDTDDWRVANIAVVAGTLPKHKTSFLLKEAHRAYKTDVLILLNAAIALTLQEWTGLSRCVIEQESHGRLPELADTARTTGWFTALYPLQLEVTGKSLGSQLKAVKERIRQVPGNGIGYSLRGYADQPGTAGLTPIRFNYLGRFDTEFNNPFFTWVATSTGNDTDPGNAMTARLEMNAMVMDGVLRVEILYNGKAHRESTITWLKSTFFNHLERILQHLANEEDIHFTPSDFNAVQLDQEELDALF